MHVVVMTEVQYKTAYLLDNLGTYLILGFLPMPARADDTRDSHEFMRFFFFSSISFSSRF